MKLSKVYKSLISYINLYPTSRALFNKIGPAVWRLPAGVRRRLCPESEIPHLGNVKIFHYSSAEIVKPPLHKGKFPTFGHRIAARPYVVPAPFIAEIKRCHLVGRHATPVTLDGRVLLTSFRDQVKLMTLEPQSELFSWIEDRLWQKQPKNVDYFDMCSFVNRLDSNYYHWMVEWCGQIETLIHYQDTKDRSPLILIRSGGPKFRRESLELLGIGAERIVEWTENHGVIAIENLLVPSIPGIRVACSPRNLNWLRSRYLEAAGVQTEHLMGNRRIYISRKKGGWRSVLNDEEVIISLEREGFEILHSETLSLKEQIRIFSECEIIVGLHGAGLTNILFAPHASLIELVSEYGGGEYYNMASCFGQNYTYLCCESKGDDVTVPVSRLVEIVRSIQDTR